MITVTTSNGKFFLSYFLNLIGNNSQVLDENELQQEDLNYILTALASGRIQLAEGDLERINTKLSLNEGGGADLTASLAGKADKTELLSLTTDTEVQSMIDNYNETVINPGMTTLTQTLGVVVREYVDESLVNYPTIDAVNAQIDSKVTKVEGKDLSTNDFTSEYKTKLDSLSNVEIIQLTQSAYELLSYEDRTKPNTLYLIIG